MNKEIILTGTVVHGKALGRTVGMPTANLRVDEGCVLPEAGVYATVSEIDGKKHLSVTNIGVRPSVDNSPVWTVESHIVGFSGDLYGEKLTLTVLEKIRPQMKFQSLDEVKKQVEADVVRAKAVFSEYENR
ncbi:MAG: riboflavin kinase [Clostridia bacterium]|nr:riboflavin kinase [Clostridia bacterium]MBQ2434190.1 riboflavin kinase [Clostridia bacterium]